MSIEDGGHWGKPLPRSLSPKSWGLQIVGQRHHNGPKLVFDILLGRGKMNMHTRTILRRWPDLGQIPKAVKKLEELREREVETRVRGRESNWGGKGRRPGSRALRTRCDKGTAIFISREDRTYTLDTEGKRHKKVAGKEEVSPEGKIPKS